MEPEKKVAALKLIRSARWAFIWTGIKFGFFLFFTNVLILILSHLGMGEVDDSTWKWYSFCICAVNTLFLGRSFNRHVAQISDKLKEDLLQVLK